MTYVMYPELWQSSLKAISPFVVYPQNYLMKSLVVSIVVIP